MKRASERGVLVPTTPEKQVNTCPHAKKRKHKGFCWYCLATLWRDKAYEVVAKLAETEKSQADLKRRMRTVANKWHADTCESDGGDPACGGCQMLMLLAGKKPDASRLPASAKTSLRARLKRAQARVKKLKMAAAYADTFYTKHHP